MVSKYVETDRHTDTQMSFIKFCCNSVFSRYYSEGIMKLHSVSSNNLFITCWTLLHWWVDVVWLMQFQHTLCASISNTFLLTLNYISIFEHRIYVRNTCIANHPRISATVIFFVNCETVLRTGQNNKSILQYCKTFRDVRCLKWDNILSTGFPSTPALPYSLTQYYSPSAKRQCVHERISSI